MHQHRESERNCKSGGVLTHTYACRRLVYTSAMGSAMGSILGAAKRFAARDSAATKVEVETDQARRLRMRNERKVR